MLEALWRPSLLNKWRILSWAPCILRWGSGPYEVPLMRRKSGGPLDHMGSFYKLGTGESCKRGLGLHVTGFEVHIRQV